MKLKSLAWLLLFWLIVGALYLLSLYLDAQKFNTGFQLSFSVVVTTVLVYVGWTSVTAVLYQWLKKPITAGKWFSVVRLLIAGMVVSVPLITYLDRSVVALLENREVPSFWASMGSIQYVLVYFNLLMYVLVFIVCAGIIFQQHSKHLRLQAIELAKEQIEMKMQALQSQLSPHFLFNCLNGISGLVRVADQNQVIQAIARLGDLLRYAVNVSQELTTPLASELDFMENYVALQKLRLGDQFDYEINCDDSLLSATCPPFMLHTLVENAFVHGMSTAGEPLRIRVDIQAKAGQMIFQVHNHMKPAGRQQAPVGLGVALKNLKNRLTLQYQQNFSITQHAASESYLAEIRMPLMEV